jgi:hypothetical protein
MSTLARPRFRSTLNRQPDRADASAAWRTHYFRDELVGSIRLSESGYQARDRRQNEIGPPFPSLKDAIAFLERGAA